MTPTSLFILTTCCLTAILAIVLLLWHRESRRLGASNADAEARERDAAARLSAAEARLAAAEQAVSAERELRQRYEAQAQALTEQRTRTEAELAALRASSETELASLRAKNAEERAAEKAEREKLEETFRAQFKNLATEILGEHSVRFRQTSQEQIDSLLKPFRDNITDFRKRVEEIYTTQTSQRGELKAELKNLMELNRRITAETTNLTNALKGNSKVQGDWGEMLLETILDSSALIKGIHYQTQYNIKDEEGRNLRPDVVLHLPEKKDIVIDSKVSLTAFVGYTSAESEEERRRHLAAHVASVRQHVAELGRKGDQQPDPLNLGMAAMTTGKLPPMLTLVNKPKKHETKSSNGVVVEGVEGALVRLSRCCNPVPGDDILGFVTRGRGVSVHRRDCPNAKELMAQPERIMKVHWESDLPKNTSFKVEVYIEALDRLQLLSDVVLVLSGMGANVLSSNTVSHRDGMAEMRFLFQVSDISLIDAVQRKLLGLEGVFDAHRMLPGQGGKKK